MRFKSENYFLHHPFINGLLSKPNFIYTTFFLIRYDMYMYVIIILLYDFLKTL